jgi:predicted dienelactone hydrolase
MRRFSALALLALAGCPSPAEAPDAAVAAEDTGPAMDDAPITPDAAMPMDAGPLPEPRTDYGNAGPYAVGSVTVTMTDRTGTRTLPVEIWYPADEAARAEAEAGRPLEAFEEGMRATRLGELAAAAPATCVRRTMHAAAAPAAATSATPWPVVIFSHCHTCTRYDMAEVMERLASHGIVVAAPDHVDNTLWDQLEGTAVGVTTEFLAVRSSDVSSVLDRLLDPSAAELPADLRGQLDASRVAVMGHSFGAATTGAVTRDDDRFIAGLAVAAPISVLGPVSLASIEEPFGFLLMREDNSISEIGNRFIRMDAMRLSAAATVVEVDDAGHWSISDLCGLVPAFEAGCGEGVRGSVPGDVPFTYVDSAQARELAADVAAGFFAVHLLGDPGGDTFVRRLDGTAGAHVTSFP